MKKILFTALLLFLFALSTSATHLMGGSMSYQFLFHDTAANQDHYRVKLQLFRDCSAGTAQLANPISLGAYNQDTANPNAMKILYNLYSLNLDSLQIVDPSNDSCINVGNACVQEGNYHVDMVLGSSPGGYHLMVHLNARNTAIVNLSYPGTLGQTYYSFIPPGSFSNSTPVFSDLPVTLVCIADTASIDNHAADADGDSLAYSFVVPYDSYTHGAATPPLPAFINIPPPVVLYNTPTYSFTQPFGPGGYAGIDSISGLTQFHIPNTGSYVTCVQVNEYRNNILIGSIRRDIQLLAIFCPPAQPPQMTSGNLIDTILPGQTLCFPVTFTDLNGDSIFLHASGNIFDSTLVNPYATLPADSGSGTVTTQFCWTPDSTQVSSAPYQFTVTASDNGCPSSVDSSFVYSIYVLQQPVGYSFPANNFLNDVVIYPNPSPGKFTLTFSKHNGEKAMMRMANILGETVFEKRFVVSSAFTIDQADINLQKGMYVIELLFDNQNVKKKLMVE